MTVQKTRVGHVDQASQITVEPVGNVTKTNVQSALEELTSLVTPADAEFLLGTADAALPNARIPTATSTINWDFATANQAKANIADAELLALAGLTSAADKLPYFTGSGTAALADLTAAARTVLDDASVSAMLSTLGGQPLDSTLTALAAYNTNGLIAQTAADTFAGRTITGPAAGITVSNGDGVAGNPTLALANDLSAVEGLASNGLAARTATDTWAVRTITAPAAGITVSNGDGVAGNPTLALADDLAALEALSGTNTIYYRSASNTWTAVTIGGLLSFSGGTLNIGDAELTSIAGLTSAADSAPYYTGSGTAALMTVTAAARTVLDDASVGAMLTTLGGQPLDATLTSLAAYNTNGLLTQTAADTFTGRTLTGPAAGITVSNGNGVSGNPTLALANDLSAVEGLASNGIATRTATDTWAVRTITGTANEITATNGDGVSGNPTLSLPSALTFTGKTVTGGTFSGPATTGTLDVQQALALTGDISPSQITADQNDYAPTGFSTASVLRLNSDASRNVTGIAGGSDGRVILIHNVGGFSIVLKDESASSTAANRFALSADVSIAADASVMLQYDATSSRWRAIGGSGGGGSGDAQTANPLSQFASTTSAQLAGVISDETGSGALVFGTSPTINGATLGQNLALTGDLTPSQITSDQNDYNPTNLSTATILRLDTDSNSGQGRKITGLQGGSDGRIIIIANIGSNPLQLVDESASSTAGNRFALTGDLLLLTDESALLFYDSTSSRWRLTQAYKRPTEQIFTVTGANTWTKPAGLKRVKVTVVGGGGGGGGADGGSSQASVASGGCSGAIAIKWIATASLGATETATVGTGGAGGTAGNNAGTAGGTSSFGAHCSAPGGPGGTSGAAGTSVTTTFNSTVSAATGGDINISTANGGTGFRLSGAATVAGLGASSMLGGGGLPGGNSAGGNATGYGAGGGGGHSSTTTDRAGGDGSNGIIIVEEFY